MPSTFDIDIREVVRHFHMELDPKTNGGLNATKFWVRCPFCQNSGSKGYKLNISVTRNAYRCVSCGEGGGVLDLYARLKHGTRHIKGPNGNGYELETELRDALHMSKYEKPVVKAVPRPAPAEVKRAPDAAASATYKALLSMPVFRLTDEHREKLLERGLSPAAIKKNSYCTFSLAAGRMLINDRVKEVYEREALGKAKRQSVYREIIGRYSDEKIQIGLAIANIMLQQKRRMDGVPGFFKLKNRWCFRFDEGMVVPTRNSNGEIVALQLRKDSGDLRYMTVSSMGLPRGVTLNISRAHFPLGNAPLGPDTKVLLTEGPLKADVALDMLQIDHHCDNLAFIALHGVNNTADLPGIFAELKAAGVTTVYNALDVDKTTKYSVYKASKAIRNMVAKAGLKPRILFWDDGHAAAKLAEWTELCKAHGIPAPTDPNVFVRLGKMTALLAEKGIAIPRSQSDWSSSSKGIDDILLTKRNKSSAAS